MRNGDRRDRKRERWKTAADKHKDSYYCWVVLPIKVYRIVFLPPNKQERLRTPVSAPRASALSASAGS